LAGAAWTYGTIVPVRVGDYEFRRPNVGDDPVVDAVVEVVVRFGLRPAWMLLLIAAGSSLVSGCSARSEFETFMQVPLPSTVVILKMDGNWGNDPWRCWELSPINEALKEKLIAKWNLAARPEAFNGVASGGKIYCRFDKQELSESYSGDSDSYRAVGIDYRTNVMVVYFYNG